MGRFLRAYGIDSVVEVAHIGREDPHRFNAEGWSSRGQGLRDSVRPAGMPQRVSAEHPISG